MRLRIAFLFLSSVLVCLPLAKAATIFDSKTAKSFVGVSFDGRVFFRKGAFDGRALLLRNLIVDLHNKPFIARALTGNYFVDVIPEDALNRALQRLDLHTLRSAPDLVFGAFRGQTSNASRFALGLLNFWSWDSLELNLTEKTEFLSWEAKQEFFARYLSTLSKVTTPIEVAHPTREQKKYGELSSSVISSWNALVEALELDPKDYPAKAYEGQVLAQASAKTKNGEDVKLEIRRGFLRSQTRRRFELRVEGIRNAPKLMITLRENGEQGSQIPTMYRQGNTWVGVFELAKVADERAEAFNTSRIFIDFVDSQNGRVADLTGQYLLNPSVAGDRFRKCEYQF